MRETEARTLQEVALSALSDRNAERAAERAERDRLRAEEEAAKDAEAMKLLPRSPLTEWFYGLAWHLVERMPQGCVIVASDDQPDDVPLFYLSDNGNAVSVFTVWPNERGSFGGRYTTPKPVYSAADVGLVIDDERRSRALTLSAVSDDR